MAYSTQRAVSDGTLQLLMIEIEFFDESEITAYFDNIPTTEFIWATDKSLRFNDPVPNGVEVLLRRTTDLSQPRHIFSQGAQFKDSTLDEDFKQILHIAQEAVEGANVGDIYQPLNMHGNPILNVGPAVDDGSAVSLGQVKTESASAWVAAGQAQAALAGVQASANTATQQAVIATTKAGEAGASATTATQQAGIATAAVASIGGSVGEATAQADRSKNEADRSKAQADISTTKAGESSSSAAAALASKNAAAISAAIADTAGLQLGMSVWGYRPQPFKGCAVDDGQELDRAVYPDFAAALDAGMLPVVTEALWQSNPANRGCFVAVSSPGKFRMRDMNGATLGSYGAVFQRGSADPSGGVIKRDQMQGHIHASTNYQATGGGQAAANATATNAVSTNTTGPLSDGTNGTPRVGAETYPTHLTGAWMTRLYGLITPLGAAEASSLATAYASMAARVSTVESKVSQLERQRFWHKYDLGLGRVMNTLYTNNTGMEIFLHCSFFGTVASDRAWLTVNGIDFYGSSLGSGGSSTSISGMVPPGGVYQLRLSGTGSASAVGWSEYSL